MTGPAHDMDDEDDDLPCYRHPDRLTALTCLTCDRPICVEECATHGAVGIKCPEHAKTSAAARGEIPAGKLARGAAAAVATSLVAGYAVFYVGFLVLILGYVAGIAVGEATRRATGGFRDGKLARIAGVCAFVGVIAFPALVIIANGSFGGRSGGYLLIHLIGAGAAAYAAVQRTS